MDKNTLFSIVAIISMIGFVSYFMFGSENSCEHVVYSEVGN